MTANLWRGVDRLLDSTNDLVGLRAQGVHLLAADHWRRTGRPVPDTLREQEHLATMTMLAIPALLTRIRSLIDGPIVLLKGPEVAARYPNPTLRPFGDLDLLVEDAPAAQRRLLEAGFELSDLYEFSHQEIPILWPSLPLMIEIHNAPNWPRWMSPPPTDHLFAIAVPSATGVAGISTLPPEEHGMLLVAHAWRHNPLRSLLDLIDVAVMTRGADRTRLDMLAASWEISRIWRITSEVIDHLLLADQPSLPWVTSLWARHLLTVRDRTVLEHHLLFWLSPLAAPRLGTALRGVPQQIWTDIRPLRGETWSEKFGRTWRAASSALSPATFRSRKPVKR